VEITAGDGGGTFESWDIQKERRERISFENESE
jgi:hypothetical protein